MGKKEGPVGEKAKSTQNDGVENEEEEDSPVIKQLKAIDDKYCAIEVEFEEEVEKLRKKFREETQKPLFEERLKVLSDTSAAPAADHPFGTPACKGFWLQAMQNDDNFAHILEEHDEPVLEYLHDIRKTDLGSATSQKGMKLEFVFKENPFFSNESLWVEFHTNYQPDTYKPYNEPDCVEIKSSEISWKPGKNVTVAIVEKKVKGGGAKKAKQKAKAKEEPRESFFRLVFSNLKEGEPLPSDLQGVLGVGGDDDDDDDEPTKAVLGQLYGLGMNVSEGLISYAVRYYTGEAGDVDDDDDDEDEEEEDSEDLDDDDESEDDAPPAKSAAKKKSQKKGGAGAAEPAAKQEECKQQ